jgi:hypothetical protein
MQDLVFEALCALIYRDLLPRKTFEIMYATFDRVVPLTTLSDP